MSLSWTARITILVAAVVLVFVCLFPFLWMALSSIKTLRELYTVPPVWFPEVPTLANYMKCSSPRTFRAISSTRR